MKVDTVLGNCLDFMRYCKDDKFNISITSPPYNMNLRIRNGKYCSRQIIKEISTKYKNFPDNLPMEDYFDFNVKVVKELLRVSSDLVFYNVQFLTGNKPALFKLIGEFSSYIKEVVIWDKKNAQPAIGTGVMNSQFEIILILSKKSAESRAFKNSVFDRGTLSNLWVIPRGRKVDKNHGAVFPEKLVDKILLNFSYEGDSIFDPFMGTGTTGVSAINHRCSFTGCELDPSYKFFADERLKRLCTP